MKYLIWDFDGTLALREGQWTGTLMEVLETWRPGHGVATEEIRPLLQAGFPWHEPHLARDANIPAEEWWRALDSVFAKAFCEGARVDDAAAQLLCSKVRDTYLNPARWALFDDVIPCLAALSADNWRHVILSNHVPELKDIIKALGVEAYFDAVFNSAETGFEKPNPRAFECVLAFVGDAEPIWMIGDSIAADVNGAKSVGLPAVLVRRCDPNVDLSFATLHDLTAFLLVSD